MSAPAEKGKDLFGVSERSVTNWNHIERSQSQYSLEGRPSPSPYIVMAPPKQKKKSIQQPKSSPKKAPVTPRRAHPNNSIQKKAPAVPKKSPKPPQKGGPHSPAKGSVRAPPKTSPSNADRTQGTSKGKKKVARQLSQTPYIDKNGDIRRSGDDEKKHFEKYPRLQTMSGVMVTIGCLPENPDDVGKTKHWLLMMHWLALLCDVASAIVAVVTFQDVTYCCGEPILDMFSSFPWKTVIRLATYLYLVMIVIEVYPVIRKGFPFNIVNPLFGFLITFAMFFDDSRNQALIMWSIETIAIICEFILYRLEVRHANIKEKELKELREARAKADVENGNKSELEKVCKVIQDVKSSNASKKPKTPVREVKDALSDEELREEKEKSKILLWYLGFGCYLNIVLSLLLLAFIIAISQGGGLCVADLNLPNPFNLDQLGRCPQCEGISGVCEVCSEESMQCFYPYS